VLYDSGGGLSDTAICGANLLPKVQIQYNICLLKN